MNHIAKKHANTLLLLLIFISKATVNSAVGFDHREIEEVQIQYKPLMQVGVVDDHQMRNLGVFQVCLECRCCVVASDPTTCSNMPCCFGIDCQLPNKPFGVCAFVPTTCNCTTCGSP